MVNPAKLLSAHYRERGRRHLFWYVDGFNLEFCSVLSLPIELIMEEARTVLILAQMPERSERRDRSGEDSVGCPVRGVGKKMGWIFPSPVREIDGLRSSGF